jgi:hypothetical protein
VIAGITLIGVGLSLFAIRVPEHVLRPANVVLSLLAAGVALYAYLALHGAFSVRYGVRIEAGWGFVVFIVSLILNILLEGSFLMFPLRQSQKLKTGQEI